MDWMPECWYAVSRRVEVQESGDIMILHQPTVSEIIKGVRHIIAEEQYSCGECEHIMEYLKGLVRE